MVWFYHAAFGVYKIWRDLNQYIFTRYNYLAIFKVSQYRQEQTSRNDKRIHRDLLF